MNRSCPICFSLKSSHLYNQDFHNTNLSIMKNYDVVVCNNCGFVFADNIPTQQEFNEYYKNMSKWEFSHCSGVVPQAYMEHFKKMANFIEPHINNKEVKIFDIGCSTGSFLAEFKNRGYLNISGLDPSQACVETAKRVNDINAVAENISTFKTDDKFDLITLSAVFEHLVDLQSSLIKISSMLKDDGLLFIEVPDLEQFDKHVYMPFQQFSIEHINYFSLLSIKNLLENNYFVILESQQNTHKLNNMVDPGIFVFSKKTTMAKNIVKDSAGEQCAKEYIKKSYYLENKVLKIITDTLSREEKVIIWGVGTHTQRLIDKINTDKIIYFVDSNIKYTGKKLKGVEIKSPNSIESDVPILISTYAFQDEIIIQIRDVLRLNNKIIRIYE